MAFAEQLPAKIAANKILKNLKSNKAKVLDVGCGDGDLLAALGETGCLCTGLEKSDDNAAAARARGLNVHIATWPDYDEHGYDVIIFSRALHHIEPLDKAISRAREILAPDGFIFVDDFAFAEANDATAAWMYGLLKLLVSQNLIDPNMDEFVAEVYESNGRLGPWKKDYVSDLNSADDMASALNQAFTHVDMERLPYLYRYVTRTLVDGPGNEQVALKIYDMETQAGVEYPGILIGRQFLAR